MPQELKTAREKAGLTQEQLARLTKIPADILSKIEHDKRRLRVTELPIIARALGCAIDALIPTPFPDGLDTIEVTTHA